MGECIIRRIDEEGFEHIAKFVEAHGLDYVGQSLPAAVQTVLFKLLKPQRVYISKKARDELYDEQGKCEMCSSRIANSEADHVAPLRDSLAGQEQPFRLL